MVRVPRARGRATIVVAGLVLTMGASPAWSTAAAEPTEIPIASWPGVGPSPWTGTELVGARAIAGGAERFVAVGSVGFPPRAAAWSSNDGLAWEMATLADQPAGTSMTTVIPIDGGFVAMGVESTGDGGETQRVRSWYSPDGLEWLATPLQRSAKSQLQAIVAALTDGPAGQLALGSFAGQDLAAQRLWRSSDGGSWELVPSPGQKGSIWHSLAALPDGYLLLGQDRRGNPTNWRSPDGLTWARLRGSPLLFDLAASPEGEVVGIGWKDIWLSRDLGTWEKVWTRPKSWALGDSNAFEWVEREDSDYLVVGHDFGSCPPDIDECHRNPLLISPDGETWTEAAGPDGEPGADPAVWLAGSASVGDATVVLGQDAGIETAWLVEGELASAGSAD